jgi:AcrR family transcriptional regulator
VSTSYEQHGRTNQKQRTREALIAAARALVEKGVTPTVEQAAAAASISRTTAYRYFPTHHALLVAAQPEVVADSLLPRDAPADPEERLAIVIREMVRVTVKMEQQLRTMLRLSLDEARRDDLPLRQGRAIKWIEEALAPLEKRLGAEGIHRLALAIRSAAGIEALVWLTDVGKLSRRQAADTLQWNARALLRTALADGAPPTRKER